MLVAITKRHARYGLAVAAAGLMILLKLRFEPFLGQATPFLLMEIAVMVSAWYGGLWPGLVTTAVGALGVRYFFLVPPFSLALTSKSILLQLIAFSLGGVLICLLTESRHRARRALQASDARFRRAVLDAPFPIMIHAEDRTVIQINNAWTEITGYTAQDIPTITDWTERAYGQHKDMVRTDIDRLYQLDGPIAEGDYTITTRGGQQRIWAFSSAPLGALPDGRRVVISMAMDITERKQVKESLRQSEERFAKAFRASPALLVISRMSDGITIDINESYLRLFGYTRQEVIGRSVIELNVYVNPDERAEVVRKLREQGAIRDYEIALRTKSGEIREMLLSAETIETDDETCILAILIDITDRKRAEEEVRKLNAELEQRVVERTAQLEAANKELEAFSYSVSHDLRAPLRSIDGFSQALIEDYADKLDATGQDYLRRIRAACTRMGQLIDDLLNLSRLTRSDMCRKQVDLSALAEEVVIWLQKLQPERQVEIAIAPGLVAHGDQRLLRVALENLLENAWKFTAKRPRARIEFGATQLDGATVYFVRDNGAGFDMAYADKLFGVFQRLHTTAEFEGTGIGLATVQRIVTRHGGRVWAEGAVDQGATFYFTLSDRGSR